MKTAIYVEDGVTQIALTPESEFEKRLLAEVPLGKTECNVVEGSFFLCSGGWNKHGIDNTSIMIRIP